MWYMLERKVIPDWLIRLAIRRRIDKTIKRFEGADAAERQAQKSALIAKFKTSPIAIHTDAANEQHYEVPAAFFLTVLGKRLKYSSCYWPQGIGLLDDAEEAMLQLTCERAGVEDGMAVLDLGCGWGSLCLWIAEKYPVCQVMAVSNSQGQREHIEDTARERGLENLEVVTADVVEFDTERRFDRILSVEMFEHMKNYERLMAKITDWLNSNGRLFVHHFSHREFAYEFDHENTNNWMAQHFFTGGTMPSDDLLLYFQRDLQVVEHWRVDGTHYKHTLNTWLHKMDANRDKILAILRDVYGEANAQRWFVYWRLFFIACAETFGLRGGTEFFVTHLLFEKRPN